MKSFKNLAASPKGLITLMVFTMSAITFLTAWGFLTNSKVSHEIFLTQQQYLADLKTAQEQLQAQAAKQKSDSTGSVVSSDSQTSIPASTKTTTTTAKPGTSASISISAADKDTTNYKLPAIQGYLEAYWAENAYYPSIANYSTLSSVGAQSDSFTFPSGIHFVYTPSPGGCSTVAKNCMHYTLDALDSSNSLVVPELKDLN